MSLLDGLITVDPCDTAWETTFAKNGSDADSNALLFKFYANTINGGVS